MGLVIDTKGWPVEALVAMATEGISVSYGEVICGGDKSVDRKIGRMLDKGKVLAAVDKLPEHLSSWLLLAYASPGYVSERRAQEFYDIAMGEFTARYIDADVYLSERKWELIRKILPLICYDLARNDTSHFKKIKPAEYIAVLSAIEYESAKNIRSNWSRDWKPGIDLMRDLLMEWLLLAKQSLINILMK